MKTKAFTLSEVLIASILIGMFAIAMLMVLRPNEYKINALKKAGISAYGRLEIAAKQVLAAKSENFTFEKMVDNSGNTYSLFDSGADAKLISAFKKYLQGMKNLNISNEYKNSDLATPEGATAGSLKVSSFTQGFTLKNGAYFALKLNGNCTTTETVAYNPARPEKREQKNSCGLIFYDVNGDKGPNKLEIDQYLIPISRVGLH